MVRPATFLAIAPILLAAQVDHVQVLEDTVAVEVKTATSVARLVTLHVTALKAVRRVVTGADTVEDTVEADTEAQGRVKPATHAVVMATCLVTAHKDRSATTVGCISLWVERNVANALKVVRLVT